MTVSGPAGQKKIVEDGNERAEFDRVYREYAPVIYRFMRRAVGAEAEDVTHGVFLTAWSRRAAYDREKPILHWLYGIARNVLSDDRRGRFRHRRKVCEAAAIEYPAAVVSEDEIAARLLVAKGLEAITRSLDRQVFELYELEGWTALRIAGELGLANERAVRNIVTRASRQFEARILELKALESWTPGDSMKERERDEHPAAILALFAIERAWAGPSEQELNLLWQRISSSIRLGDIPDVAPSRPSFREAIEALATKPLATGLAGLVTGTVLGVVGHAVVARPPPAPAPSHLATSPGPAVSAPALSFVGATPATEAPDVKPAVASDLPKRAARAIQLTARPPSEENLTREQQLLEQARMAIARGDAAAALRALADHEARFAKGELAEQRDAIYVQALVRVGRREEAATRAAMFRRQYPASIFRARVDAASPVAAASSPTASPGRTP